MRLSQNFIQQQRREQDQGDERRIGRDIDAGAHRT